MTASHMFGVWEGVARRVGDHLWQSTLFAIVVGLLAIALRKNHARTRYWLWLAASIKFLVPFSLLVMLGSHLTWLRHPPSEREGGTSAGSHFVVEAIGRPFTVPAGPGMTTVSAARPVPEKTSLTPPASASSLGVVPAVPLVLATVWLMGSVVVLSRWILRWWRIRAVVCNALPMDGGREVIALRKMEQVSGLRQKIEMRSLPVSLEPGIFGLIRPVLLWPQGISERLNDAHMEAILAHEVWHVRRRDNLTAAMHMIVEAVFWFHPGVWWLETRLVEERERACDEEVLAVCVQRETYAQSILNVCEFCSESSLLCMSGITGADLKGRIRRIMTKRLQSLSIGMKVVLAAFGTLSIAGPILLGGLFTPLRAQNISSSQIPSEIEVDQYCRIITMDRRDPAHPRPNYRMDRIVCHTEGANGTRRWEETIANGVTTKRLVHIREHEFLLQNPYPQPVTFLVHQKLPKGYHIDSFPRPSDVTDSVATFRVAADPGQTVRLHVGGSD